MAGINFNEMMKDKAKKLNRHIVLPDGIDERSILAARTIVDEGIAQISIVGNADEINKKAAENGVKLDGINVVDPETSEDLNDFAKTYYEKRKHKGMTEDQAVKTMKDPLFYGTMMVEKGIADGSVAGSLSTTADVMRAAIQIIGVMDGVSVVSSFFNIVFPDRVYAFADSAVLPKPDTTQLAEIAITTADNYKKLLDEEPRVAMLSFSTLGSAKHELLDKVISATKLVKERRPDLKVDGELQFDAAIVPKVAAKKCPDSPVEGKANVLIFPDLNAGNIGYKIAQRLGGADAIGPVVQGLKKPAFDLSRGCNVNDIVTVTAINAVMGS